MEKNDLKLPSTHEQKGYHVKTIEQLKTFSSPKDVSYNLTESHQVSAASVDYSRSSRQKVPPPLPAKDRVKKFLFQSRHYSVGFCDR